MVLHSGRGQPWPPMPVLLASATFTPTGHPPATLAFFSQFLPFVTICHPHKRYWHLSTHYSTRAPTPLLHLQILSVASPYCWQAAFLWTCPRDGWDPLHLEGSYLCMGREGFGSLGVGFPGSLTPMATHCIFLFLFLCCLDGTSF